MKLRIAKYLLIYVIAVLLQTTLCHAIAIRGIQPDLILLFIIYLSMKEGALVGVYAGFFAGLFYDVYSPQMLGTGSLAKCLLGYLTGLLNERTIKIDDKYRVGIVFLASLLHNIIIYTWVYNLPTALTSAMVPQILPSALYTTFAGGLFILVDSQRS